MKIWNFYFLCSFFLYKCNSKNQGRGTRFLLAGSPRGGREQIAPRASKPKQGCHQIREIRDFRENQGNSFSIKATFFKFLIVLFQSSDFLHTQPCVQLRVIVAKFYPFVYHSALCSHFEAQFHFVMKPKV